MKVYYDFNGDAGGYVKKDAVWWYGSYREFNTEINEPRFPVKPHQTKLRHFSGKTTFSLPSNNKIIGSFMRTLKIQPTRLDARRATNPINLTEGSTQGQRHWAWVYKARMEQGPVRYHVRRSPRRAVRLQLAARAQRQRDRTAHRGSQQQPGQRTEPAPATEPPPQPGAWLDQLLQGRPRPAATTSSSAARCFTRRSSRSSSRRRTATWPVSYHAQRRPVGSRAARSGAIEATLMTYSFFANDTWRVNNRLTLTPGLRFDRFANSLPEQEHPAGRFSSDADRVCRGRRSGELESLRPALRRHLRPDRAAAARCSSSTTGSTGGTRATTSRPPPIRTARRGSAAMRGPIATAMDPGTKASRATCWRPRAASPAPSSIRISRTPTRASSPAWFERELAANFGVRTGLVMRQIRNQRAN